MTFQKWLTVAETFETRWNLPHCLGALAGKHIAIKCPPSGGSAYFNYKHFHSIVLLVLVGANYNFLYVSVGATGAGSDGGVFMNTDLKECFEDGSIDLPPPSLLPGTVEHPVGYFMVANDAFPLRPWLMKPIPLRNLSSEQHIHNYRLSKARGVVGNAFGILAARYLFFP